jgi:Protein kinase domain
VPELTPGSEFAGYTIEDIAGRGGMGVVYRARQHRPARLVALKVIAPELANDPDFRARFERESDTAASIEHPNVIPVYEVNDVEGLLFITMRFVEGTDLRALIAENGRLAPELAADLIGQIASALDAAHERGLVHRDVKPANVLIAGRAGSYHAYLTDFGLTKHAQAESGMTKTGMFVGTLDYIAPEQLMGGPLDARADVYALGCVLYQVLTGHVPFPADSGMAKMYAHGNQPPPMPSAAVPGLPSQFDDVIARAMAKDPNDRYLSAGDLGRAARAAVQAQSLSRSERSVAKGEAAPADATAVAATGGGETAGARTDAGAVPTAAAPAPTAAAGRPEGPTGGGAGRNRLLAIGGGAAALVLVAVVAILALGGGSSEKKPAPTSTTPVATPSGAPAPALSGEEGLVADSVNNAQRGFRNRDVELYCLSRSTSYLAKVYGGGFPFATCKRAGKAGLKVETPAVLKGGDLSIDRVSIGQGGKGTRATVIATGDNGAKLTAVVRRNPPSDDVWRVDSFSVR